jgi:hypothetical protein
MSYSLSLELLGQSGKKTLIFFSKGFPWLAALCLVGLEYVLGSSAGTYLLKTVGSKVSVFDLSK